MGRCSPYTPFYYQERRPSTGKTPLDMTTLKNTLLKINPAVICQGPEKFQTAELPVAYPITNQYTPITVLITYVQIKYSSLGFISYTTAKQS